MRRRILTGIGIFGIIVIGLMLFTTSEEVQSDPRYCIDCGGGGGGGSSCTCSWNGQNSCSHTQVCSSGTAHCSCGPSGCTGYCSS
jgi:hypothetical protein